MHRALTEYSAALGRQSQQVGSASLVNGEECVEDGGHQDASAIVRFGGGLVSCRIGLRTLPLSFDLLTNGLTQRPAHAGSVTELSGELSEKRLVLHEVALRGGDLIAQNFRKGKVL